MLNYTTTTIVNDGSNVYGGAKIDGSYKYFRVKFGPELKKDADHTPVLVKKTPYQAATLASATVVLPTKESATDNTIYRIAMYIRLRNNNNPYFYNEWTFKGKPLFIEFTAGETSAEIVNRAKKLSLAQYGYDIVKFEAGAAKTGLTYDEYNQLYKTNYADQATYEAAVAEADRKIGDYMIITAADQWEIFMDQDNNDGVKMQYLETVNVAGKPVKEEFPHHEEFLPYDTPIYIDNGNEAFGDFAHIVKDLRLPSEANLRWYGTAQGDVFGGEPNDDKPMPNGHYTQYTIQYTAERGVLQQTALAGAGTSRTVHVFYVEEHAVSDFEDALTDAEIALGNAKRI